MNDNMGAVKPNGVEWTVKEQIVRDLVTGLTFQFEVMPDGCPRLIVTGGTLEFGNREIVFTTDGVKSSSGTHLAPCPTPSWVRGAV